MGIVLEWIVEHLASIIISGMGALGSAGFGAWLLKVYKTGHWFKRQDDKDAWARLRELIERQDQQIARQQSAIEQAHIRESVCQHRMTQAEGILRWMHDCLLAIHRDLVHHEPNTPPLPNFPSYNEFQKETAQEVHQREFEDRQMKHSTQLLKERVEQETKNGNIGEPDAIDDDESDKPDGNNP